MFALYGILQILGLQDDIGEDRKVMDFSNYHLIVSIALLPTRSEKRGVLGVGSIPCMLQYFPFVTI